MTVRVIKKQETTESDDANFLWEFLTQLENAEDDMEYIDEYNHTTYTFIAAHGAQQISISMLKENFMIIVTPMIPITLEILQTIQHLFNVDNLFSEVSAVDTNVLFNDSVTYRITKKEHIECMIKSRNLYEINNKTEDRKRLKLRFNSKLDVVNMSVLFFNLLLDDKESFLKNASTLNIRTSVVDDSQGNRTINVESDALGLPMNKKGGFCLYLPVDTEDPEYYTITIHTKKLSYLFKMSQEFPLSDAAQFIEGFLVGQDPFNMVRPVIILTACFPGSISQPSHADRFEFKRTAGHVHLTLKPK